MTPATPDAASIQSDPVTLSAPVARGDEAIALVAIRRPNAGELRGLSMLDVAKLDVDALRTLLPRITVPPLVAHEIDALPPADLFALATEVAAFLLPPDKRPDRMAS